MRKEKLYERTYFLVDAMREAISQFDSTLKAKGGTTEAVHSVFDTGLLNEDWRHDNINEFFSSYRKATRVHIQRTATVEVDDNRYEYKLHVQSVGGGRTDTVVSVSGPSRSEIEAVFEIFERYAETSRISDSIHDKKVSPSIFIGHGHSLLWRDLKDHLHEQHGFQVLAYESGARAGHAIRDILQEMLDKSAFAVLVLTCDDQVGDEIYRARQNVIHEVGLFQGRLGFTRAVVLLENGVEGFSNMHGIHYIPFSKGNIKETFGDVLATIRREFVTREQPSD